MAVASRKRNGKGTRKEKRKKRHQLYLRCYGLSISFRGKIQEMLILVNPRWRVYIWLSYYALYFSTFHKLKNK